MAFRIPPALGSRRAAIAKAASAVLALSPFAVPAAPAADGVRGSGPDLNATFEHGLVSWDEIGSAFATSATAARGAASLAFGDAGCGGDAVSRPLAVEPGATYRLTTDYRTDGGGGFIGVNLKDARGKQIREVWLIGDGGSPTYGGVRWRYNVDERRTEDLYRWDRYTATYTVPAGVASVAVKIENWGCGGLPDDPLRAGVFFDDVRWAQVR